MVKQLLKNKNKEAGNLQNLKYRCKKLKEKEEINFHSYSEYYLLIFQPLQGDFICVENPYVPMRFS